MSARAEHGLTETEIRLFHNNGFLKLDHTLPEDVTHELEETIWRHIDEEIEPVQRGDDGTVGRISDVIERDEEIFWEVITGDWVMDPLESLLGSSIAVHTKRHNHATLRRNTDVSARWHRDVRQWSRPLVTALFYLTDTNLENGCTRVVPNSQYIPSERLYEDGSLNEEDEIFTQEVPVPMPRGGILLINSLVMHRVGMNHTDEARMSMTIGYHSEDSLTDADEPNHVVVDRGTGGPESAY